MLEERGAAFVARPGAGGARPPIVIEVPSPIAAADLAEQLRPFTLRTAFDGGDSCRVVATDPGTPDGLRTLLERVSAWASGWQVPETTLRIGGRRYVLRTGGLGWSDV